MHLTTLDNHPVDAKRLDKTKCYLLFLPYIYDTKASMLRCLEIMKYFRSHECFPFSPTFHLNEYHEMRKAQNPSYGDFGDDYYAWDMFLYKTFSKEKIVAVFASDWNQEKPYKNGTRISHGCQLEMRWATENNIPCLILHEDQFSEDDLKKVLSKIYLRSL